MAQADIIKSVLEELGVLGVGQVVSPEDAAKVEKKALSIQEELSVKNKIWWPDLDCVPLEAENAFIDIIAGLCVNTFGLVGEDAARAERNHDKGMETLNELRMPNVSGEQVEMSSY